MSTLSVHVSGVGRTSSQDQRRGRVRRTRVGYAAAQAQQECRGCLFTLSSDTYTTNPNKKVIPLYMTSTCTVACTLLLCRSSQKQLHLCPWHVHVHVGLYAFFSFLFFFFSSLTACYMTWYCNLHSLAAAGCFDLHRFPCSECATVL